MLLCRGCQKILYRPCLYSDCGCVTCITCARSRACVKHEKSTVFVEAEVVGEMVRKQAKEAYAKAEFESKWEIVGNRSVIAESLPVIVKMGKLESLQKALSERFPGCVVVKSRRDCFFFDATKSVVLREVSEDKEASVVHICLTRVESEEEAIEETIWCGGYYRHGIFKVIKDVDTKKRMMDIHEKVLRERVTGAEVEVYVRTVPPSRAMAVRLEKLPNPSEAVKRWLSLPHTNSKAVERMESVENYKFCTAFLRRRIHPTQVRPFDLDRAVLLYEQLRAYCAAHPKASLAFVDELLPTATELCRMVHTVCVPELIQWVSPLVSNNQVNKTEESSV